jgi:hypothetical protein
MTQTYRNAVLNISADASINAFGGCFKGRDPLDSTPLKMSAANIGLSWWLTPDKRYQFAWMQEAPTFARAWVHRERQLSPRILHFTNNEVIWECTGSPYSSEIYPGGAPFQGSFNGDNKYQIISLLQKRKNKKMHGLDQVYETWNEVCDKFSIKRISFPTDMPVVVAGVAEEFAAMLPADEYVAGLWRSTLPQSLLWTRTGGPERPKDYIAPSWSWISTGTSTKQRYRGYQHPILAVRDIELKRKSSHVFGALEYGALKVTGILRHIHLDHLKIVERTGHLNFELSVDERGVERLLGTSQNEYDGPLCQIWSDYIVKRTWQSVYCLFVAIRHFTGAKEPRTITALLLEKDESEGNDGKTFKRVGMMHFADLFSLKVRYQVRPGFEGTEDKWKQLQAEIEEAHKGKKEEDYPIKQPASLGEIDPMDVYQFDVAGEFDWVERLTPEDVTLI